MAFSGVGTDGSSRGAAVRSGPLRGRDRSPALLDLSAVSVRAVSGGVRAGGGSWLRSFERLRAS